MWYAKITTKATDRTIHTTHLEKYEHLTYLPYNSTGPQIMEVKYEQRQNHHDAQQSSKNCVITNCHCWQQQTATNYAFAAAFAIMDAVDAPPPNPLGLSKKTGQFINTDQNVCNMSRKEINILTM